MSETIDEQFTEDVMAKVESRLKASAQEQASAYERARYAEQEHKKLQPLKSYEPASPASYLELSVQSGSLIAETEDVMTSAVGPYVKHYIQDKIARNQKIPYSTGMAILNLEGALLEMHYGKYASQRMRDKVREYMADPEQIPEDALGIGGVDVDVSDLAQNKAA
jgi:hypothetical protein